MQLIAFNGSKKLCLFLPEDWTPMEYTLFTAWNNGAAWQWDDTRVQLMAIDDADAIAKMRALDVDGGAKIRIEDADGRVVHTETFPLREEVARD